MSDSNASPFYVVSPFKLAGEIVKPSADPIAIPADLVDELQQLGLISDQPGGGRTVVVGEAGPSQSMLDELHQRFEQAISWREAAEADAIAAEARRDVAIAEAEAAEARRDAAIAAAAVAERTVVGGAEPASSILLGSDAFPAHVRIGDTDVALGELVAAAAAGLAADAPWNDLKQADRDAAIQAEIDRRAAPPAKPKSDKAKR